MGVCLQHGGAGPHHLPALAPQIARSANLLQPALRGRKISRTWQSSLASGVPRSIDIEDEPRGSLSIPQPTRLLRLLQRASHQIFEKQRSQRLDRSLIQSSKKAAQRRTSRQSIPSEQSHERGRKRLQTLIERFERAFATAGIAQQHCHEVDDVIVSEAAPRKAHAFFNESEHTLVPETSER